VVGDVDDLPDLGHRGTDGDFDALAERHPGHATALAAASQPEIHGGAFDPHQFGLAAVGGDGRVDLLGEHLSHPFCQRTRYGGAAGGNLRAGIVRVVDAQARLPDLDRGALEAIDTVGAQHHRKVSEPLEDVLCGGIGGRDEGQFVGELEPAHPVDRHAERELPCIGLLRTDADDCLDCLGCDGDD
jgi:hypothetical protein